MNKVNSKKIFTVFIIFLTICLFLSASISTKRVNANPSAERKNVDVTTADVIYPDRPMAQVDTDNTTQLEFRLDIEVDKVTVIREMQDNFDDIKAEYQENVIVEKKTVEYFDLQIEDVITQYNGLYRQELEKYTRENFVLDCLFDITVNQETLDQLAINDTYVRVKLDFGNNNPNDPLPIILYKCDGSDTWEHFDLIKNETTNRNWAERIKDGPDAGKIYLYFYTFCPIMVLEPTEIGPTGCNTLSLWIILAILILMLIVFLVYRLTRKDEEIVLETANSAFGFTQLPVITDAQRAEAVASLALVGTTVVENDKQYKYYYHMSFIAKMASIRDKVKERYNIIKNIIFDYKNVKAKATWATERFTLKRHRFATLKFHKNVLYLIIEGNYQVQEKDRYIKCKDGKVEIRLSNNRNVVIAKRLIKEYMLAHNAEKQKHNKFNYVVVDMPREDFIAMGFAKVVKRRVPKIPSFFAKRKTENTVVENKN